MCYHGTAKMMFDEAMSTTRQHIVWIFYVRMHCWSKYTDILVHDKQISAVRRANWRWVDGAMLQR